VTRATLLLSWVLAAALAAALAGPAASQQHDSATHDAGGASPAPVRQVSIGFADLRPAWLDVVTGETVRWTNDSVRVHTVTADDASFDSGRFGASQTFSRQLASAGEVPYHCRLHPSIKGVVAVHDLLLDAPTHAAAPDAAFPLTGRAGPSLPAGTEVSIEADIGAGFVPVSATTLAADGAFSARLIAPAAGRYRAVAAGLTSAPVDLLVLDRNISLSAGRARGSVVLRTTVTPAAPGGKVVLQLFLPERFGWWPVRQATLGRTSSATFTIHSHRRLRARVRYTLDDGATALATSRIVHVGPQRQASRGGHHG
jgi:plastocyanin